MQTDKSVWLYAYQNDFIYCLIAEKDNDFNNIYSIVKCNPKTGETEKLYDICYEKGEEYKLNAISSWFVTADEVILYCWLDTCSADSEEKRGNRRSVLNNPCPYRCSRYRAGIARTAALCGMP